MKCQYCFKLQNIRSKSLCLKFTCIIKGEIGGAKQKTKKIAKIVEIKVFILSLYCI